ncbi:MAG: DUF6261 family protein [Tannerella sp.]|jgi:hypothetical protein|nr:DUF6261 family protein [Tannerella sp.]
MEILKLHFEHLRNEAHYQFMLLVKKNFEANPEAAAIVSVQLAALYEWVVLEGQLVDSVKASEYTGQIVEADRRLDDYLIGLNRIVMAMLKHFDPDVVNAARKLTIRLKSFRGGIVAKAYEEESGAVKILVADLRGAYAPQVTRLNLEYWVKEIEATQAEFERLFLLRSAEHAERPAQRLKEVRRRVEDAYRQVINRIEAYTLVNGDALTAILIRRLNEEIKYFCVHNLPHGTADIRQAVVAFIPDQPWRGQPVVLLPQVTYEGRELVFSRDYEVLFKYNDHPGNALLIVRGKGVFAGRKQVSFNIVAGEVG